ncbi:MAG: alpha/beta hydrolase [Pseudomonadota bacterium]
MPELILQGPEGRIEARYSRTDDPSAPTALILHPHPLHGGSMNNKVTYALFQSFASLGFACLRFNFRGVGRSQGSYSKGDGELSDAAAALDWLQLNHPHASSCWVAGFSFGAWIGMQILMRRPELAAFVSVAPPCNIYDFGFLAPCPTTGLIIQGDRDKIVPASAQHGLLAKLSKQRGIKIAYDEIKGADHFFTNQIDELRQSVCAYVYNHMQVLDQKHESMPFVPDPPDLEEEDD